MWDSCLKLADSNVLRTLKPPSVQSGHRENYEDHNEWWCNESHSKNSSTSSERKASPNICSSSIPWSLRRRLWQEDVFFFFYVKLIFIKCTLKILLFRNLEHKQNYGDSSHTALQTSPSITTSRILSCFWSTRPRSRLVREDWEGSGWKPGFQGEREDADVVYKK